MQSPCEPCAEAAAESNEYRGGRGNASSDSASTDYRQTTSTSFTDTSFTDAICHYRGNSLRMLLRLAVFIEARWCLVPDAAAKNNDLGTACVSLVARDAAVRIRPQRQLRTSRPIPAPDYTSRRRRPTALSINSMSKAPITLPMRPAA
jgi:hypothetical protein